MMLMLVVANYAMTHLSVAPNEYADKDDDDKVTTDNGIKRRWKIQKTTPVTYDDL